MDLSKISTRDLVDELQSRDEEVCYITNARTSRNCVAFIEGGELLVEQGENIILIVKGLY